MNVRALVRRCRRGQATVEFSLAFFMIALGTFGAIDASRYLFTRHDLSRAAEVMAHEYSSYTVAMGTLLQDGQQRSGLGFSTATPTDPVNGNWDAASQTCTATGLSSGTCQVRTNANVTIVGVPSLDDPTYNSSTGTWSGAQQIYVTVSYPFTPALGMFLGGKKITMQETESAVTAAGEGG
jgi:Flp pilus assembly protein TadG